jgi:hypothetical protein
MTPLRRLRSSSAAGIVSTLFFMESQFALLPAKGRYRAKDVSLLLHAGSFTMNKDERIIELEEQIERLKCCGNCKHYVFDNYGDCYCEIDYFAGAEPHKKCLLNENKWELYQQ